MGIFKVKNKIDNANDWFWSRVKRSTRDDCWEWLAGTDGRYGIVWFQGRHYKAHRLAYFLTYGIEIPDGLMACHHCDNTKCCNPDHIFIGTNLDNMADMRQKKRRGNKTYCNNGHLRTKENTRNSRGYNDCLECSHATRERYKKIRKAKRAAKKEATHE